MTMEQSYDGTVNTTSTSVATSGYSELLLEIPVTAGADKLDGEASPGATTTATAPEATGSSASTAASNSDAQATETSGSDSDDSDSDDGAATSTDPGNAGPMVTQNAILAGVAAFVGGAMIL